MASGHAAWELEAGAMAPTVLGSAAREPGSAARGDGACAGSLLGMETG